MSGRAQAAQVVLGVALGAMVASCNAFDASLLDGGANLDGLRKAPPRPPAETEGPSIEPLRAALGGVVLDQGGGRWRELGLDLDDLNTATVDDPVECRPPRPTADVEVDGVEGIDNAFGNRFFPIVQLVLSEFQEQSLAAQAAGEGTLVLQMSGWNGQDEDPRVDIFIAQSVDGTSAPEADVELVDGRLVMRSDGSEAPPPALDGNDTYWLRDDAFVMGDIDNPRIRDDNAYVTGRQVVMRLPDRIQILFFATGAGVKVRLTGGTSVARINDDNTLLSDVLVAGRWSIVDLLDTADNVGVCSGGSEYRLLLNQLETIADVRSTPGSGGDGVECDAMSVGVPFSTGVIANIGGVAPSPELPNPCAADGGMPDAAMPDAGTPDGGTPDGG